MNTHSHRSNRSIRPDHRSKPESEWITIRGRSYEVLEQLSVPNRGRWKVRDPEPTPNGTLRTAIVLPVSKEENQLRKSVDRLPKNHNGLPNLVSWESKSGTTYIVVSYCEGTDLATYLSRFKKDGVSPISVWEAVRRVKSLAHSLADLHTICGVVHGDIKPANLILPSDPGALFPIDFGSSWQMEKTARRSIGDGTNRHYSSPEVFLELPKVNARADQFSVGVVLFEMLTLELPYIGLGGRAGHPGFELAAKDYRSPSQLIGSRCQVPPSIMQQLDEVVRRSIALDPAKRFPTMKRFAQELDRVWLELQKKADRPPQSETFFQTVIRWVRNSN